MDGPRATGSGRLAADRPSESSSGTTSSHGRPGTAARSIQSIRASMVAARRRIVVSP